MIVVVVHGQRVSGRGHAGVLGVVVVDGISGGLIALPVTPHHVADLGVEKAIGKSDSKALKVKLFFLIEVSGRDDDDWTLLFYPP